MTADAGASSPLRRASSWLASLRADRRRRRGALVAAVVAGLWLAWTHWLGLVLAGAMIGLSQPRLGRAVVAALLFGGLSLSLTVVLAPTMGAGAFVGLAPVNYVTAAVALLGPVWGSLVRGVV